MAEPKRSPDQEFAEWYVWAKREISTDNRVCQGAAQAAIEVLADGADRPSAIQAARRSQAGHSLTLASRVPALRRSYAEWYDWARREIGGHADRLHQATEAAIETLQAGGGSAEAAAAARSAVPPAAPQAPPPPAPQAAPPASPPVGYGGTPAHDQATTPAWTYPGAPVPPGGPNAAGVPAMPATQPPGVQAGLPYAGFWRRLGALAIDLVFVLVGSLLVTLLIGLLLFIALISTSGSAPTDAAIVQYGSLGILLVLTWLYFAGLESSSWQATVGKRITGLLVTDVAGRRLSFWRATARYFAKILSALPILIGYLLAAFTPRKQALHDLIAGTLVVKRGARTADVPSPHAGHQEPRPLGSEAQRA